MLEQIIAEISLQKSSTRLAQYAMLLATAALIEMRDPLTAGHSSRVGRCAAIIAHEMGLITDIQKALRLAGLVHDIGKIDIPKTCLQKPGKLTETEMSVVRKHPVLSYEIVAAVPGLQSIANIVLHHHERIDGNGYPHGLAGERIPLGSRILCVADSFDAMVTDRAYRPAMSVEDALAELERCAGTQFDPAVVQAFTAYLLRRGLRLPQVRV
ncbi:MAG: HD-GYP domain-containing protein [Bacillota bacterium]